MGQWRVLEGTETRAGFDTTGQSYRRMWCESYVWHAVAYQVRFVVAVDASYPGQSRFVAELWMNGGGWVEAVRMYGDDPRLAGFTKDTGYMDRPVKEAVVVRVVDEFLRPGVEGLLS